MTALAELQLQFQQFVLGGAFAAMRSIEDGPRGKPGPRLAIYHDAYRTRLRDALADTFGTLHRLLGDAAFAQVGAGFIESTPSTFRNIRWYGSAFADFLHGTPPYDRQPWLAEIARLDWTLVAAFDAADAKPIGFDDLAALSREAWPGLTFGFHPSVRRLTLATNAAALRQAADRDEPLPDAHVLDAPVDWIAWRRGHVTHFRSLHAAEADAIDNARAGQNFTAVCDCVGRWVEPEHASTQAALWLRQWIEDELLASAGDPRAHDTPSAV